jgi:hypothetical protein
VSTFSLKQKIHFYINYLLVVTASIITSIALFNFWNLEKTNIYFLISMLANPISQLGLVVGIVTATLFLAVAAKKSLYQKLSKYYI